MIVVQDAAHCRTRIQHDFLGPEVGQAHSGRWRLAWDLGQRGQLRSMAFDSHLPFERPPSPHLAPHLYRGAAVGVAHRRGDIPHEVIGALAVRDPWKLRGDPAHERVLLVRHPAPHRFAQPRGPHARLDQSLLDLSRRTGQQGLGTPDPCARQFGLCRKFCSGGRAGGVAPVGGEIRRPGRRTVRPQ